MPTSPTLPAAVAHPTAPRRRRRIRRTTVGLLAAGALVVALGACTPSAAQVERKAVANAHAWFEGRSVSWQNMTCTEFVLQGSSFNGTCWAEGHEYHVSTTYQGDVATAYVRNAGGLTRSTNWIKDANGNWQFFSWQF
jgi:hypothetical protein